MRIRHFHPVDLDEDEIVQLLCQDGCVQLRNDFSNRGCFARTWRPGDVDTGP